MTWTLSVFLLPILILFIGLGVYSYRSDGLSILTYVRSKLKRNEA